MPDRRRLARTTIALPPRFVPTPVAVRAVVESDAYADRRPCRLIDVGPYQRIRAGAVDHRVPLAGVMLRGENVATG